jgi:low affinity Fe/Cu permease
MEEAFRKIANKISDIVGSSGAFIAALTIIIVWAICGPVFKFSDTWQLVINTSTTIITFLMVFLIQNTQNRDSQAIHLKLDELIHAVSGARNKMVDVENMPDKKLESLHREFEGIHKKYGAEIVKRRKKGKSKK